MSSYANQTRYCLVVGEIRVAQFNLGSRYIGVHNLLHQVSVSAAMNTRTTATDQTVENIEKNART